MNNFDLAVKIEECLTERNALDAIEKLVELRKEYKDSEFYKNTKIGFDQCVEMYGKVVGIQSTRRNFADMLEDYLLNLDTFRLQRMADKFTEKLETVDLTGITNVLNNLTKELNFEELQSKLQEFGELNIKASNL